DGFGAEDFPDIGLEDEFEPGDGGCVVGARQHWTGDVREVTCDVVEDTGIANISALQRSAGYPTGGDEAAEEIERRRSEGGVGAGSEASEGLSGAGFVVRSGGAEPGEFPKDGVASGTGAAEFEAFKGNGGCWPLQTIGIIEFAPEAAAEILDLREVGAAISGGAPGERIDQGQSVVAERFEARRVAGDGSPALAHFGRGCGAGCAVVAGEDGEVAPREAGGDEALGGGGHGGAGETGTFVHDDGVGGGVADIRGKLDCALEGRTSRPDGDAPGFPAEAAQSSGYERGQGGADAANAHDEGGTIVAVMAGAPGQRGMGVLLGVERVEFETFRNLDHKREVNESMLRVGKESGESCERVVAGG